MKKIIAALLMVLPQLILRAADEAHSKERSNLATIDKTQLENLLQLATNNQNVARHLQQENQRLHEEQQKEWKLTTGLEVLPGKIVNRIPHAIIEGATHGLTNHYVVPKVAATLTQLDQTFMPTIAAPILDWLKPQQKPLTPEEQKKHNHRIHASLAAQKGAAQALATHEMLKAQQEEFERQMAALNRVLEYKRKLIARTTEAEAQKKLEAEIKEYEAAEAHMVLRLEIALDNDIHAHQAAMQLNQRAAAAG